MGDLLLRRYATDMISRTQQLSAPTWARLRENPNFIPSGEGVFFAIEIQGNEAGGQWRQRGVNQLPVPTNEQVKKAQVLPKKYYHVVTFDGLAESVSARGGEDAFVSGITYALSQAVRRAGANFETTFLRGDGTGRITNVSAVASTNTVSVADARAFRPGQLIEFLSNTTGLRVDGPVTVTSRNLSASPNTITVSSAVSLSGGEGVYIAGEQSGAAPPQEVTILGLPALVNNTGVVYNYSRVTYPSLQSKVINASSTALDESMLRRLRKQLMIETAVDTLDGYAMISNHDQFDRYTEIALPFRRFLDNRLELGADQSMTTFEGRPWYVTWAAIPSEVYFLNLAAIERGTVRPLSIDERVNFQWIPGMDAFCVLLKYYGETVGRMLNQTAKITGLTTPTY
jgi:hypothetical protein